MDLILALLILYVAARIGGEAMEQLGQSPMVGELLAGVLLGPSVFALIDPNPLVEPGASLGVVATIGVLVLVLLAGLEFGREGLAQAFRERSIVVAFLEFVLPFALGYTLATGLGLDFPQSLFLGTALAVTALPVSVRILMDLNLLHSKIGRAITSVALANDLVAFAMLGLVLDLAQTGGAADAATLGFVVAKNLLFLGLVYCVSLALKFGMKAAPSGRSQMQVLLEKLKGQERGFAISVLLALALGAAAEAVGIHFAVGVFYGGLLIRPKLLGEARFVKMRTAVSVVTLGLFAPLFFAFVGVNFRLNFAAWPLIVLVTAVAFVGKLAGGILGGYVAGFRGAPLVTLGVGLNARGMMELLLAQVGLAAGIITADLYSALIVMTLVTTLSTPPLMKRLMRKFRTADVLPSVPVTPALPGNAR